MKRTKVPEPRQGRTVAIYCRKSDVASGEVKGRSTSQQLAKCLLAARSLGFDAPERFHYIEEDGNKGEWFWRDLEGRHPGPYRPELTRLMEEVESGECPFDCLMVWRTDRAYRDEIVAGHLLRALRDNGVRLYALTHDLAIHTASGYQAAATEACANKAYRDKISEDVCRDHEMRAEVGMLPGDPTCFGFSSAGKGTGAVIAHHDQLDVVRQIFTWYARGEPGEAPLSMNGIAVRCMERGIELSVGAKGTKPRDRSRCYSQQVSSILKNARFISKIRWGGKLYDTDIYKVPAADGSGRLETVVPEDLFLEVEDKMKRVDRFDRDRRGRLLSGTLVCPDCGRRLYFMGGGDNPSLNCRHRSGMFKTCQGSSFRGIGLKQIEAWTKEHLAPLLVAEIQALRALQTGSSVRSELDAIERKIEQSLRLEGETLAGLVGTMDASQFAAVAARLKRDRTELETRATELRAQLRRQASENKSDPFDLIAESNEIVKQALRRAVRWICVTRSGIVVLTRMGAYVGARFEEGAVRGIGGVRPPVLLPPSVEATRECRSWITNEERFVAGLGLVAGRYGRAYDVEQLLPRYVDSMA